MFTECREIHAPAWTRTLLNAQKRFPRVQDLQGEVPRSSRACGKNLEESCQIFKQRSRDNFEVLKNLQRFSENLQRFLENLQRFLGQVGVFQFECPTLFAVPTASNHVNDLFHNVQRLISQFLADYFNVQQLISSRGARGACALVW